MTYPYNSYGNTDPQGGYTDPQGLYPEPPHEPKSNTVLIVSVTVAVIVALIAAGLLTYVFVFADKNKDSNAAPSTGVTVTASGTPSTPQPSSGTAVNPVEPSTPPSHSSVTTTVSTPSHQVTVPGADAHGFLSSPRCNDSADPAVFIGDTGESRVVICQVGRQTGRYYYKGQRGSDSIELQYPSRNGNTFTADNNGYQYTVSPNSLMITERDGRVIANEPMLTYWLN